MKEIGGYFEIECFEGKKLYKDLISLNYARNALEILAKERKISKIYLPYYLCNLVFEKCNKLNIFVEFYHIDFEFKPILENIKLGDKEYIYIVNYYGLLTNEYIKSLKMKFSNIIVDNVQAFFQEPIKEIDTIYSCRKFFGVPDGAYLSANIINESITEEEKVIDDIKYMIGRLEGSSASEFYNDFKKVSDQIKDRNAKRMSKFSDNILKSINYKNVKKKRENNFKYLHKHLENLNLLNIPKNLKGPYMYPFLVENSEKIKNKLIKNKIYIPLLWPNIDNKNLNEYEKKFINNILPLPIDQRYNEEDMKKIIELIKGGRNV